MRVASVHLLLPCAVALAGCPSSPGLLPVPDADAGVTLYDDLASGSVSGARWDDGEFQSVLAGGTAVLSEAVASAQPNFSHGRKLVVVPPDGAQVTTLEADVTVTGATASGDTIARAGIELLFQPLADRVQRPYDLANALLARIFLQTAPDGRLVAVRQLIECLPDVPDCSAAQGIGTSVLPPERWPSGVEVSLGSRYTMRIEVDLDPDHERFTFTLRGEGGVPDLAQVVDVSSVQAGGGLFKPDLGPANFYRADLAATVRGGPFGGGDGSIVALFDDVRVGVDGLDAAPFDDFEAGSRFDTSRWKIGGASAVSTPSGLQVHLEQADRPAAAALSLATKSSPTLGADITVVQHASTGSGGIAAEIRNSLYNDGTNGSGVPPDVNAPSSQVGDLLAVVSMTGTDASHAVIRCETALCTDFTFVEAPTSLGPVALGTKHAVQARWEPQRHVVVFQLDGGDAVEFDPVAAGYPIAGEPRSPCKRIGVQAGASGPSQPFGTGSAGSLTAIFANVRIE